MAKRDGRTAYSIGTHYHASTDLASEAFSHGSFVEALRQAAVKQMADRIDEAMTAMPPITIAGTWNSGGDVPPPGHPSCRNVPLTVTAARDINDGHRDMLGALRQAAIGGAPKPAPVPGPEPEPYARPRRAIRLAGGL